MVRTPLSEAKITEYDKIKKNVTFRYKQYEFDHEGKLARSDEFGFETMSCLELLARLSLHIPQPYRHKVKILWRVFDTLSRNFPRERQ